MAIDWDLLVRRIRNGACIPFLGAAANVSSTTRGYKGTPLGDAVSRELANKLTKIPRDPDNLARVSLHYEVTKDRPDLDDRLREIISEGAIGPSPLLVTLADLPFRLIVTTNYDRLMEKALTAAKKKHTVLVQPSEGFEPTSKAIDDLAGYDGTIVYKIHGSFVDAGQTAPPVVLTEEDYIQFLCVVTSGGDRVGVPNLITGRLASSSLLFLGYGLEDWDFRVLYKSIVERLPSHKRLKSYAVQKNPNADWVRFWVSKGVEIHDMDVYEFAAELQDKYTKSHV